MPQLIIDPESIRILESGGSNLKSISVVILQKLFQYLVKLIVFRCIQAQDVYHLCFTIRFIEFSKYNV